MAQREQWKRWQVTKSHLRFAIQLLPDLLKQNDGGDFAQDIKNETLDAYNEYLEHNELELALDQLEGLGERNAVPPAYWRNLANAAETMDLHERAMQLMDQFRLALAISAAEQSDAAIQSILENRVDGATRHTGDHGAETPIYSICSNLKPRT